MQGPVFGKLVPHKTRSPHLSPAFKTEPAVRDLEGWGCGYLVFLSWSRIFFSISASVRVSSSGHHWSASPVFRMAISTVGRGFSLWARVGWSGG